MFCYPSPLHLMQMYSTVACMWYKMSTIWWIVVQSVMAYKLFFYNHYTCPVTVYVYNRCSNAIMLCTTGNQIIGILYHTYAFVQYICIKWTGLGQQHIATCLLLQLGKKIRFRKGVNGVPLWEHPHCSSLSSVCASIQCNPTVPPYNWWPRHMTDKTILSTTKQRDPPQNVAQHYTPLTHHQQEQKQPMALLWAIGCTGRIHWPCSHTGLLCASPDNRLPRWTYSSAASPDHHASPDNRLSGTHSPAASPDLCATPDNQLPWTD